MVPCKSTSLKVLAILAMAASSAMAVHTQKWLADNEAEFRKGKSENVVVTSAGELRLSREFKTVVSENPKVGAILAMAQGKDGTIYAATAPEGQILAIKDGKSTVFAEMEQAPMLPTILVDDAGRVLVGTAGEKGKVLRFPAAGGVPETVFEDEDTESVWALLKGNDGTIYAATGPVGKLVAIKGDGKGEVVYKAEEENLLSLALGKSGEIFIGTDPKALVYRFDPVTKKATVLFDAPEEEISSLTVDAAGNLYAATGSGESSGVIDLPGEPGHKGNPDNGLPDKDPGFPQPPPQPPMKPPEPAPKENAPARSRLHSPLVPFKLAGPANGPTTEITIKPPKGDDKGGKDHAPSAPAEGNVVYRIDPEGFVSEVFRAPVTIYAISEHAGVLTIATGSEGLIYEVNLALDETGQIARTDAKDVTALLPLADGSMAVGTSNAGTVATLSSGLAKQGTYTSEVLDATAVARLGVLRLDGTLPAGTGLTVATRSGNVDEPSDETWSPWSAEFPAQRFLKIPSPAGRYFQYRLTFKGAGGPDAKSAIVRAVEASYLVPNEAPKVKELTVEDGGDDPAKPKGPVKKLSWEAEDANTDTMTYRLDYRPSGEADWRPLKDKVEETTFDWDTREVPDGRYQVRVTASDAADNERGSEKTGSRVSTSFLIDNTPPTISPPAVQVAGAVATLKFTVADAAGTVAGVKWRVGASDQWRTGQAEDKMLDSPSEAVTVTVEGLTPGRHVVAIKATDDRGNESFENVLIDVPPAQAAR